MIRSVVGKSRTELRAAWHEWRQECQTRRDRGEFIGCPELNILCGVSNDYYYYYNELLQILGGVEECFKNAKSVVVAGVPLFLPSLVYKIAVISGTS